MRVRLSLRAKYARKFCEESKSQLRLLSCEIGAEKPDPEAYSILLNKLGLPAKDVVFIDDRLENVEQAKEHGLDAILFQSSQQLRQELRQRNLF